jgi:uncharacterized membrane protein
LRHRQAHHEVRAAGRLFRLRIWLSSAMWVPVLGANVLAVGLALALPIPDQHIGAGESLPIAMTAVQAIFGALAGGMITFTGIVFSAVFVAAQIQTSSYVGLGLLEIRHYGHAPPQVVRRLHALYDRLCEVVDEGDRARVELERRLLDEAVRRAFPDPEERAIVEQSDRLGLGGAHH